MAHAKVFGVPEPQTREVLESWAWSTGFQVAPNPKPEAELYDRLLRGFQFLDHSDQQSFEFKATSIALM